MDLHSEMILDEYRSALPVFAKMQGEVMQRLHEALAKNGIIVTAIDSRIKTEESLAGKLALKGAKYATLSDITDILGARIITFYTDDVDRIAAMAEQLFEVDWTNSVDKRKLHELDSFGYNSLQSSTICLSACSANAWISGVISAAAAVSKRPTKRATIVLPSCSILMFIYYSFLVNVKIFLLSLRS